MLEDELLQYQREMILIQGLPRLITGIVPEGVSEFLAEQGGVERLVHDFYDMLVDHITMEPHRIHATVYAQTKFPDAEDQWSYLTLYEQELATLMGRTSDQFLNLFPYRLKGSSRHAYVFQKLEGMELIQYVARQRIARS